MVCNVGVSFSLYLPSSKCPLSDATSSRYNKKKWHVFLGRVKEERQWKPELLVKHHLPHRHQVNLMQKLATKLPLSHRWCAMCTWLNGNFLHVFPISSPIFDKCVYDWMKKLYMFLQHWVQFTLFDKLVPISILSRMNNGMWLFIW